MDSSRWGFGGRGRGGSWHDGCRVACLQCLPTGTRTRSAVAGRLAACGWGDGVGGGQSVWQSGSPCHSGGLVGWVLSPVPSQSNSQPSIPIIVHSNWIGLDWTALDWIRNRLDPLVLPSPVVCHICPPPLLYCSLVSCTIGPLRSFPTSSTSCNYSTTRVLAVAFNAAIVHDVKSNSPARQSGCHCRRSDRQP